MWYNELNSLSYEKLDKTVLGEFVMYGYVYIRFEHNNWPRFRRYIITNRVFDKLIENIAIKFYGKTNYGKQRCLGKAKKLIVSEANRLLAMKRVEEKIEETDLLVYHRVSLKQLSRLRKPMNGYTTCYAGVIIMAMYNLLSDEAGTDITSLLNNICDNDETFLCVTLKEQYKDLIHAFHQHIGEFNNIDNYQYKLAMFYDISCANINQHFNNAAFNYIVNHTNLYYLFSVDSIPSYNKTELVR